MSDDPEDPNNSGLPIESLLDEDKFRVQKEKRFDKKWKKTVLTLSPEGISLEIEELTENANPQAKYHHTYTLLAWGSGMIFMALLLLVAVFVKEVTNFQYQIFVAILSLAGGAFATVISGLLDIKMKIGNQLVIGATGALAVFVLLLFFLPKVVLPG